jgi:hypothetical protein
MSKIIDLDLFVKDKIVLNLKNEKGNLKEFKEKDYTVQMFLENRKISKDIMFIENYLYKIYEEVNKDNDEELKDIEQLKIKLEKKDKQLEMIKELEKERNDKLDDFLNLIFGAEYNLLINIPINVKETLFEKINEEFSEYQEKVEKIFEKKPEEIKEKESKKKAK